MLALIERSPDIYLDEIQDQLLELQDIEVSTHTISRTLKRLGMSSKKVCLCSWNQLVLHWLRTVHLPAFTGSCREMWGSSTRICIWNWPVSTRVSCCSRWGSREHSDNISYKWVGHAGFACSEKMLFCSGNTVRLGTTPLVSGYILLWLHRYSLLPALTVNGIIYSHIKEGAYNGDQFTAWLEGLLEVMNPYPAPNSVLILDNCRIHHVEGVEELCAQQWGQSITLHVQHLTITSGVRLVYLPPYSPDLNPIEECFSWVKHYIRRHGVQFRNIVEMGNDEDPYLFLYHALDQVPPHASRGWFHHSGYL